MRKLGRLLLLGALAAAILLAWRAQRSSLPPALGPVASATGAGAAARPRAGSARKAAGVRDGGEHPGAVLAGRVVRADTGQPVPGAIVDLREGLWNDTTTIADAEGGFRLEGLLPSTYRPRARAEGLYGLARESVEVVEGKAAGEITIAVHPVASLRGRIEFAGTSVPCPGGVVALQSEVTGEARATADGAGDLVFPALLPGRYDVHLTCKGHAESEEAPPVELGDTAQVVTFTLTEQLGISGIVVDETDTPPPGPVKVEAERIGEEDAFELRKQVMSRDDGSFDFWGMQAGTYRLRASVHLVPVALKPATVVVAAGAPRPSARLVVRAWHRLAGTVVDARGKPTAGGGMVEAALGKGSMLVTLRDDGRFEIDGLQAGRVRLSVELGGVAVPVLSPDAESVVPAPHPLTLVVGPSPFRIEGRVIPSQAARHPGTVHVGCRGEKDHSYAVVRADDDGRFFLNVKPDEAYALEAHGDHGETAFAENVAAGAHPELRLQGTATLRGTADGAPRAFRVSLSTGGLNDEVFFATGGAWEMRDIPAGKLTVDITALGLAARAEITLAPGETRTLNLRLAPPRDDPPAGEATDAPPAPRSSASR